MQQLPEIEKSDWKEKISCVKWTIHHCRRKVCINFLTDTDMLKLTEYESLLAKRIYILSYLDMFHKRCIVLDETNVQN